MNANVESFALYKPLGRCSSLTSCCPHTLLSVTCHARAAVLFPCLCCKCKSVLMNICSEDILRHLSKLAASSTNSMCIQEVRELFSITSVIFLSSCFNSLLNPEDNQLLFISSNGGNGFMTTFRHWSPIQPPGMSVKMHLSKLIIFIKCKNIKCEAFLLFHLPLLKLNTFLPHTPHCE